jgi:hypothetical protein
MAPARVPMQHSSAAGTLAEVTTTNTKSGRLCMKLAFAVGALALLGPVGAQAALPPPAVIPFDAAYMVDAPTSVVELDTFALGGTPPTLFVDLPGSSPFTFLD